MATQPVGEVGQPIGVRRRRGVRDELAAVGDIWDFAAGHEFPVKGCKAEIVDLRTLRPLDMDTVLASLARTHRALIVDEGWRTGSLAGEISAQIAERGFYELDAPVARVCSAEIPIPYPKHLEDAAVPQPAAIAQAARQVAGRA